jgi:hypothetical protein
MAGISKISYSNLEIGGWPSAVMIATFIIEFEDGSTIEREVSYKPEGIIYESFVFEINRFNKYVQKKRGQ